MNKVHAMVSRVNIPEKFEWHSEFLNLVILPLLSSSIINLRESTDVATSSSACTQKVLNYGFYNVHRI